MEVLATVDWLIEREGFAPTLESVKKGLAGWPAGKQASERKLRLFSDQLLQHAIDRLQRF